MSLKQTFWAALAIMPVLHGVEITVGPGQSIQAAVDTALPGDQVTVLPGTYHEAGRPCPENSDRVCAVVISADSISLIAKPAPGQPVILENPGGQNNGIVVAKAGASAAICQKSPIQRVNGVHIEGFLVRKFATDGILLFCVDNWLVERNVVMDNAVYGIFPIYSTGGRMTMNTASGAHDTGFYIGVSSSARVDNNFAHDNVSGFEIENSVDIELDHNASVHNTAGILMFILPELNVPLVSSGNRIHDNFVYQNNSPNSCLDPTDDVCQVPQGVGILAVGGDHNEIDNNEVADNQTFGIALSDVCTAFQFPASICAAFQFSALPEMTRVESNRALGNGSDPKFPGQPGADLIWSGLGKGNCWADNYGLVVPGQLPVCQ